METLSIFAGDRAFVALRAYDVRLRGVTARSGSCSVLKIEEEHALIAAPPEFGTCEG